MKKLRFVDFLLSTKLKDQNKYLFEYSKKFEVKRYEPKLNRVMTSMDFVKNDAKIDKIRDYLEDTVERGKLKRTDK